MTVTRSAHRFRCRTRNSRQAGRARSELPARRRRRRSADIARALSLRDVPARLTHCLAGRPAARVVCRRSARKACERWHVRAAQRTQHPGPYPGQPHWSLGDGMIGTVRYHRALAKVPKPMKISVVVPTTPEPALQPSHTAVLLYWRRINPSRPRTSSGTPTAPGPPFERQVRRTLRATMSALGHCKRLRLSGGRVHYQGLAWERSRARGEITTMHFDDNRRDLAGRVSTAWRMCSEGGICTWLMPAKYVLQQRTHPSYHGASHQPSNW